jgi:hypothetical protein
MSVIKKLLGLDYYGKKSFTYFLPAPPERNTGYQEKEFDQIISFLANKGYEILDFHTQSISYGESNHCAGIWIVCLLGCKSEKLFNDEINIDYTDVSAQNKNSIQLDPSIIHD